MQPQSDKQTASRLAPTTPTTAAAAATATGTTERPKVKVIKSKRPLCHFKFYLDICDHQLAKRIEADIKALGGNLEFFLSDSITHFVTDKPEASLPGTPQPPKTPATPATPGTPGTGGNSHLCQDDGQHQRKSNRQSRADAILSRVRRQPSTTGSTAVGVGTANTPTSTSTACGTSRSYTIWQTDHAQRFFRRIQTELRQYLEGNGNSNSSNKKEGSAGAGGGGGASNVNTHQIQLKKQYVKIESVKRNYRPYYHLIKQPDDWPKIDLSSDDGAFRLLTKVKSKEQQQQSMTRKSLGSRTSQRDKPKEEQQQQQTVQHPALKQLKKQAAAIPNSPRSHCRGEPKESSEKQGGVCEICKLEYDILDIHLKSKDHELFAKNSDNFLALDTLIQSSANVNRFLEQEPDEESEIDMDVDEQQQLLSASTANEDAEPQRQPKQPQPSPNSSRQRPSPALREKSKRITKGKHSSEKFQATPPGGGSPMTPSPSAKKSGGGNTSQGSLTELQRQEQPNMAAATPTTHNTTRRKTQQNSGLSPPIRAMLPPSSLYKVVETRDECGATPPRRSGIAGRQASNVDSPSLIVKFQKVRQSELQRLNGEAENFMFPRTASTTTTTRSSSELLTDVDRQTTSDVRGRHSISSASLDTSTSEAETQQQQPQSQPQPAESNVLRKRAQAVGRRRRPAAAAEQQQLLLQRQLSTGSSSSNSQQRFPSAPIQPDDDEPTPATEPELKVKLKQPPATRKSSRTATAIVTAATTSSQQQQLQLRQTRGAGGVKLEDRMGEATKAKIKIKLEPIEPEQDVEEEDLDLDDEEEEEEEFSCSSGSDEDYVADRRRRRQLEPQTAAAAAVAVAATATPPTRSDTREQRAERRRSRLTINRSAGEMELLQTEIKEKKPRGKSQKPPTTPKSKGKQKKGPKGGQQPSAMDMFFDCSKSELLRKMQYTFESLPNGELWNRVFMRQDAGEENYYTYYGSTRYRKLPYEMGPIPMARTLPAHSCALCRAEQAQKQGQEPHPQKIESSVKKEEEMEAQPGTASSSSSSSMYKHKKMHLLQRYQQEQQQQQQLQQQQHETQLSTAIAIAKCDSKASTPELLEREFATDRVQLIERVRSTSSSSSGMTCRNKQLARLAELPPRKSPREHASTLALVSCIIRQRQDSQSKTNSEAEPEPPPPVIVAPKLKTPLKQEPAPPASPRNTRSQAATPVEELRFATEISETVKRMRRGQNKYDHSPPAPAPVAAPVPVPPEPPAAAATESPGRSRRLPPVANASLSHSYARRLQFSARREACSASVLLGKRKRKNHPAVRPAPQQPPGMMRGVRKLPSKKGLLEYEMEPCAFKALDKAIQHENAGLAAWQLDRYLELAGKEFDLEIEDTQEDSQEELPPPAAERMQQQTPPPTDFYFTSEFDLCDLLTGSAASGDDEEDAGRGSAAGNQLSGTSRRLGSTANLYTTYYRKRKSLKSKTNRTGWPKTQHRRRGGGANGGGGWGARSMPDERINFKKMGLGEMSPIKQEPMETEEEQTTTTTTTTTATMAEKLLSKEDEDDDEDGEGNGGAAAREEAVMTPPATDVDEQGGERQAEADADENESLPDDDETMADSVDEQQDDEAEIEATDADIEEEEDEEEEEDVFEDAFEEQQVPQQVESKLTLDDDDEPPEKRARLPSISVSTPTDDPQLLSPGKKLLLTLHNGHRLHPTTSTPSTTGQHQQRRGTPQLNGSLGSCISPSEKLGGDNSDIFTVSSDGLDTDLDLSNTQAGDSHEHCPHQQQQQQTTPKRKFDISKYAPPNSGKAASSCAAEAATAAVKSLAISQFLKKETCANSSSMRSVWRRAQRTTISAACINGAPSARVPN
ncbi:protein chiffon [Drosophila obscura]|uniref:protein chiffon n=1 Tax=Drosophila obscura TaxID=7282 RepID=UPI001BB20AC8|nr:protein chiffon [Drosophila obscura]XP_022214774.2 protein chiffon [Drosophila obscura]XP_022214775.2 protein chiffon [Drosophila obscura]XP_022214776.2 protein chiffon [Drosophila obscura]XP_022214777.2 protein chiffon [Drosophila obscura]